MQTVLINASRIVAEKRPELGEAVIRGLLEGSEDARAAARRVCRDLQLPLSAPAWRLLLAKVHAAIEAALTR